MVDVSMVAWLAPLVPLSCLLLPLLVFVAAAAGDAVAVLLSSSQILPFVAGAGRCHVVPLSFFFHAGD